ncbi:hypothetical protein MNBD_IGNAVI01-2704 [hydrothermal vent metagenome]|uniref:Zn-ribbon-containing, possibly RNA-binding protein and truncated derivatives n=1 Tax=hydrothermal vent metagenome TaxID=652676 RepID=A0A3B1CMK7_9ZZZZ
MPKDFRSLSDVIYKEKAFKKIVKKANEQEIVEKFGNIFPELKKVAKAVKVEKKTLYLKVENSVWRSELNLKQEAIIKKIKSKLEKSDLERIKFIS